MLPEKQATSPAAASPQEFSLAHDDDDEVPPSASSESAPSIPLGEATRESGDAAPGMQKMMQEAFPMDKVQNGLGAAKSWVSWGWGNMVQGAKKIGDDIANSEIVKETERIAQKAEENISQGASEAFRRVSQATDIAVNKAAETMTQLDQDIQSGIATTEEKAKEIQEQLNPKLKEAGESARKSLMGAASWGAKTAIWFQSFGTGHADDSDEESAAASSAQASSGAASGSASGSGYPAEPPSTASMPEASVSKAVANGGGLSPMTAEGIVSGPEKASENIGTVGAVTKELTEEKAQKEAEEKARKSAEEKAQKEAEEKALKEAEEKARKEAEEKAQKEAEEKARKEAEEKAKKEAEEKAKKEAEEKALKEAEEKAQKEAEEKAQKEAEEKAQQEAEEKARKEAEEKAQKEAEEKAKKEAEEKAKKEEDEKAKKEAEEKAKKEEDEKAKKEAEEKALKEAEEKAQKEAEEKAQKEAEEKAKKEAEEKAQKEAEEKAQKEAEEKAVKEAEEKAIKEAEDKVMQGTMDNTLEGASSAQPVTNGQSGDKDAFADWLE